MSQIEDKSQDGLKTKDLGTNLQISMDSGIGSDTISPKSIPSITPTSIPFDPIPHPSHTEPCAIIDEKVSCVKTESLARDKPVFQDQKDLLIPRHQSVPSISVKPVLYPSSSQAPMDFNNNISFLSDSSDTYETMKESSIKTPTSFYTIPAYSHRRTSIPSNFTPSLQPHPTQLSTSFPSNSSHFPFTSTYPSHHSSSTSPPAPPSFWHPVFQSQKRCNAGVVDIAIRGASQKHAVFTPPRVDSSISLDLVHLDEAALIRSLSNRPNRPPRASSTDIFKMLSDVEREVGAGLRLVSDIVHVKQTGLGHGYHIDEHPSLMYNRAYSRSFPGAPSFPSFQGDDDDLLGCHGFKRKKDRDSKRW